MSYGYAEILYEAADGVAQVTLNRPDKLNAWTLSMGAEVEHALRSADADPDVRVIVVTGAGKGYCAGADMDMLVGLQGGGTTLASLPADAPALPPLDEDVPAALRGPYSYPMALAKPVIAAVNGVAAGLGLSYMLYYDMRFASERARFGTIFARRGLVAEHGSAFLLPRLVGMHNACDLLYSGRLIDAQEAQRMGLVNRVIEHERLLPEVRAYAQDLAANCSPRSLKLMKRQLYGDLFTDLGASIRLADQEMVRSFGTEDFKEGVASFLKRRPPRFTGR
ncbi:enoyl-CoA hydratase/isomerase family protein [Candidatus Binatia bacterium]|nr:enoyl-CoA hydratase/isomerase family protein [Candidatus Binatia bacterium]